MKYFEGKEKILILKDSERQPCEIWSRVMGYYRPLTVDAYKTSEWNKGKLSEHRERVQFKEEIVSRHL